MFKILSLLKIKKKKSRYAYASGILATSPLTDMATESPSLPNDSATTKDKRIVIKPFEVYKQILGTEPKMNLHNLVNQIKIVKRRLSLLTEELGMPPGDEPEALKYLKARLKYKEHSNKFTWKIVCKKEIDALLGKYKLSFVPLSMYHRNVPAEAIDEIEKYLKIHKLVTKDDPAFTLIIDEGDKEEKKEIGRASCRERV